MIPCVLTFIPETENIFIQKIFPEPRVRKNNLSKGNNSEKFKPYNLYGFLAW
jgi:hypothetical protein